MKELEEKIINEGEVYPGNILKVGGFLNHQINVSFLMDIGKEIARLYADSKITKILTIEASGIAIAVAAANYIGVPVVFAKKHTSKNIAGEVYFADVESFTHGNTYRVVVCADYLKPDDKILIVDDFLANGRALEGLASIVKSSGAELVGAAITIEKGFQHGGDQLRKNGMRIESLAIIDSMSDGKIIFRKNS